jgi:hypothetical protein
MDSGDVVRHRRHGVGVVLRVGPPCVVRFQRGKAAVDPDNLSLIFEVSHAEELVSESVKSGRMNSDLLRGVSLWLRSADPRLSGLALATVSRVRHPRLVEIADVSLMSFPEATRVRVIGRLSEMRGRQGLADWPSAVKEARFETAAMAAVQRQIGIVAGVRRRLGRPALSASELQRIEGTVRGQLADPQAYRNFCWNCRTPVHAAFNPSCPRCGWLVCTCGGCRSPSFVDHRGESWLCPQELDLATGR